MKYALLAQLVEHLTLNQGVQGSSPWRRIGKPELWFRLFLRLEGHHFIASEIHLLSSHVVLKNSFAARDTTVCVSGY